MSRFEELKNALINANFLKCKDLGGWLVQEINVHPFFKVSDFEFEKNDEELLDKLCINDKELALLLIKRCQKQMIEWEQSQDYILRFYAIEGYGDEFMKLEEQWEENPEYSYSSFPDCELKEKVKKDIEEFSRSKAGIDIMLEKFFYDKPSVIDKHTICF